jgi:hypothetical protein
MHGQPQRVVCGSGGARTDFKHAHTHGRPVPRRGARRGPRVDERRATNGRDAAMSNARHAIRRARRRTVQQQQNGAWLAGPRARSPGRRRRGGGRVTRCQAGAGACGVRRRGRRTAQRADACGRASRVAAGMNQDRRAPRHARGRCGVRLRADASATAVVASWPANNLQYNAIPVCRAAFTANKVAGLRTRIDDGALTAALYAAVLRAAQTARHA